MQGFFYLKQGASMTTANKIRALNDQFRTTLTGGRIILTEGVSSLGEAMVVRLMYLVQQYDSFTADNDTYGEHDFGTITLQEHKFFWKIDYYDRSYTAHSADAADPSVTNRVLTIMLAEEY